MAAFSLPSFFSFVFVSVFLCFCSPITLAGVPALEHAGSAIGVQTLGCIYHAEGMGLSGRICLVRRAWAHLSAREERDERTSQPALPLTDDSGVVSSMEMPGLEEGRGLDPPTLPLAKGTSWMRTGYLFKFQPRLCMVQLWFSHVADPEANVQPMRLID